MKNTTLSRQFTLALFFVLLTQVLVPQKAWAQGVSLKISPATLQIEAKPPADVWAPFTIENTSNQPISLKIGYKPFNPQASSNGNVVFLTNGQAITGKDKKIFQKMQVVDDNNTSHDTISLGPKQKERFRLRITLPNHEPTSDYYFSLIFIKDKATIDQNASKKPKKDQKSTSSIETGIGMNVFLAIGAKETPQGYISTFSTSWFRQAGPVPFTLTIHNSGPHFFKPKGEIYIKNMFGQIIGKINIPSSIIIDRTGRTFTSKDTMSYANKIPTSQQKNILKQLVWPEDFLLGMYTAELSVSFSANGPTYTRSIHFFALPLFFTLKILTVIVVLVYIYIRVKRKMQRKI